MRTNLPVTTVEQTFGDNESLVSKTDAQGHLTYCNDVFLRIAGFSEDELIGQQHHVVRHPDMPSAAFADLWQTIQSGKEWSGIVKNRCKNGGFYWVDATITPSFDGDGHIIAYMSVRRKPDRDQIAQAESLYAQMRASEGRS